MRGLALALAVVSVALVAPSLTTAATPKPKAGWPVTVGERGKRVCNVLYLLHGYRPSRFRSPWFRVLKGPVPKRATRCVYRKKDAKATRKLKLLIGYRATQLDGSFGRKLRTILVTGRQPSGYRVRATRRIIKEKAALAAARREAHWADRLVKVAFSDLGCCAESNNIDGPRLRLIQSSTGAYGAAWCMSAQQSWRIRSGMNTIATRSAHVFTVIGWAKRHGLISRIPRRGYMAAYTSGEGHIELVYRVTATHFYTIGGNTSGNVTTRYYRHGSRAVVFIAAGPDAPRYS